MPSNSTYKANERHCQLKVSVDTSGSLPKLKSSFFACDKASGNRGVRPCICGNFVVGHKANLIAFIELMRSSAAHIQSAMGVI